MPTLRLDECEVGGAVVTIGTEDIEVIQEPGTLTPSKAWRRCSSHQADCSSSTASLQHISRHIARLHHSLNPVAKTMISIG